MLENNFLRQLDSQYHLAHVVNVLNTLQSGFSLGILKHTSGTPCLAQFGIPDCKICVQVSEYDESSWSYETRAAPIATSEFEIRYALSKLTKLSDKFICFPTSHSLCIIRFALIVYDFCEAKAGFFDLR